MLIMVLILSFLILSAFAVLVFKNAFVRENRSIYKGKLPVRFLGWFESNLVQGTSSSMMASYMRKSNYYSFVIWILSGLILLLASILVNQALR